MKTIITFLPPIEFVGGILLLIAPFVRRYRLANPRWMLAITFLAGVCVLGAVLFAAYVHSLRSAHEPSYWRFRPLLFTLRILAVSFLTPIFIRSIYVGLSKNRSA